jgi:hypothetical protein
VSELNHCAGGRKRMPDKDDEALLSFLNIVRNNQELYMKNQWQVAYFTFLLYGAVIYSQSITQIAWYYYTISVILPILSAVVIYKLGKSIKEHQDMAIKIYKAFPSIEKILFPLKPHLFKKRCLSISNLLMGCVIVGFIITIGTLGLKDVKNHNEVSNKISSIEKKLVNCIDSLNKIENAVKGYGNLQGKITVLSDQQDRRFNNLEKKINHINVMIEVSNSKNNTMKSP